MIYQSSFKSKYNLRYYLLKFVQSRFSQGSLYRNENVFQTGFTETNNSLEQKVASGRSRPFLKEEKERFLNLSFVCRFPSGRSVTEALKFVFGLFFHNFVQMLIKQKLLYYHLPALFHAVLFKKKNVLLLCDLQKNVTGCSGLFTE